MRRAHVCALAVGLCLAQPAASLTINTTGDAQTLVNALLGGEGGGITVTSAVYSGYNQAAGTYISGPLGIADGIILTTGQAQLALPPNNAPNTTYDNPSPGDVLCQNLVTGNTFDAAKLTITFDLEEHFDGLSFLFVFGSEEYPEYVGTQYNDALAIYLNGTQVAFDNMGNPITINGPFFSGGSVITATETEYDGSTTLLQTKASVGGQKIGNVMQIAICDTGDGTYDSGVFLANLTGCVGDDCSGTVPCTEIDDDDDGASSCDDCNDENPAMKPGGTEVCDGVDNDCDQQVDEGGVCCVDPDADGACEPDDNCPSTPNPDQIDGDGDGAGDACDTCPSVHADETCISGGVCLGEGDAVCADGTSRLVCVAKQLVPEACPTSACADTGSDLGGGTCSQTDFYCSEGQCLSETTTHQDACAGDDTATVNTWSCQGGTTCVESTTSRTDSCTDSGTPHGAGACSATNWTCQGNVLTSNTSGGQDTCGGDADAPSITVYSCAASDGTAADTCAASVTTEEDSCTDSGDELGGGTCSASNWRCDGTATFTVSQGDTSAPLLALGGTDTVQQFYSYGSPDGASANAGEETPNRGNIYLYHDQDNDLLSLILVLDEANDGSGGRVHMHIDGLTASEVVSVKDDPGDGYNVANGNFTWNWAPCCTDGMAITFTDSSACLTLNPNVIAGINSWAVISHNPDGTRDETILPSLNEPISICTTSSLHNIATSGDDVCGGSDATPAVQHFSCTTTDGGTADTCTAATTTRQDSCSDDGTELGGGSCAAVDWQCAGGALSSAATGGTDTCGGTGDSPSISYLSCQNGNECVADTTTLSDSCSDSGDELGGGSCAADDWSCDPGDDPVPANCTSGSYDGSDYAICQGGQSFAGAQAACADMGWTLAHVDSEGENTFLVDTAYAAFGCSSFSLTSYWVANLKSETSATWPSGEPVFAPGEPNGDGNNIHLMRYCSVPYGWNDVPPIYQWGWICEAPAGAAQEPGQLVLTQSSGEDLCGGDADAPSVTWYGCAAGDGEVADSCVSSVTIASDSCMDTGTASGGGTCNAIDWTCDADTLSSTATSGVDSCGDGSDQQTDYFVCQAGDGTAGDTCVPVPDTTAPELTCPERVVAGCTRFDGVFVDGVLASSGDVCDASVVVTNDHDGGGQDASGEYPIGETTVVFTATDDAGNTSTCTTVVEVQWTPWSFAVYAAGDSGLQVHDGALVSGEAWSGTNLHVHKDAMVEGAAFAVEKAHVHKDATVTDGVFASDAKIQGNATHVGPVPANAPFPPAFDSAIYDAALAAAAAEPHGNVTTASLDLMGGTVLVNGNVTIEAGGSITGPGTLVATGTIHVRDDASIGDGVTLIAEQVHIGRDGFMGGGGLVYGAGHVHLQDGASLTGSSVLSQGHVQLQKGAQVTGLVFAVCHVQLHQGSQVSGSVISHGHVQIHQDAVVAHDCGALDALPPGLSQGTQLPPAGQCGDSEGSDSEGNGKSKGKGKGKK